MPVVLAGLATLVACQLLLDPLFPVTFVGQATSNALAICALLPWLLIFTRRHQVIATPDASTPRAAEAGRVLLLVIALVGLLLALAKVGNEDPQFRPDLPEASSWLLIAPALTGQVAAEELIFRVVLPAAFALGLTTRKTSFFWGTVLANLAFAWWHLPASLPEFVEHFAFGLLMAFFYARTKSVLVPIALHLGNNLFVLLIDAPLVAEAEVVTLLIAIKYALLFGIGNMLFQASPNARAHTPGVPALASGRQTSLDALRGLALIAIVLENSLYYAVPEWTDLVSAQEDRLARGMLALLIEYRGLPIFCILLGFTAHLMVVRTSDGLQRLTHRAKFFLIVGALHGVFVFPGDILAIFGVSLLALMWFRRRAARTRHILLWLVGGSFIMQAAVGGWGSTQTGAFDELSVGMLDFREAGLTRGIEWLLYVLTAPFHISAVLFPLLVGFTTWRRISESHVSRRKVITAAAILMVSSVLLCLPNAILLASDWGQSRSGVFVFLAQVGGMSGAFGAWLLAVRTRGLPSRRTPALVGVLIRMLATLGRRTLTLYLGSSALFFIALSPAGLNLLGNFPLWSVWALVLLGLSAYVMRVNVGPASIGWAEKAQQEFVRPAKTRPSAHDWSQDSGDSRGSWISLR